MLRRLIIGNFKSIDHLVLDLGRVNLIIGENGCGKTNILEALGMASAAAANTLDPASLKARGIRVTDPAWMRSGFERTTQMRPVEVIATATTRLPLSPRDSTFIATIHHDNTPFGQWTNHSAADASHGFPRDDNTLTELAEHFRNITARVPIELLDAALSPSSGLPRLQQADLENRTQELIPWFFALMMRYHAEDLALPTFLTYAPREDSLRDLARDSDIEPIGIHGEGLFKLLQVLDQEGQLPEIKEQLALLGWFDDLTVTSGTNPSTRTLQIHDVYIDGRTPFDQRSANEGFLFVLLYACLLVSKYTPRFFAVDNVDAALNPKLCAGIVRMFAGLTAKHDKQVILTTHNPGALDGIDLNDDEQRLFVVYRNTEGKTRARRITPADLPSEGPPVRLSEAFLRGYLGALPTNF